MLVQFERFPMFSPMRESFVDDMFGSFLTKGRSSSMVPSLDVSESADDLVIVAELPGVAKDDVKVTLHDGVLTISGEKKKADVPEGSRRHRVERVSGTFTRSLELPVPVNASAVSAEMKDGILRIVVPKAEEARPREIRVN